MVSPTEVMSEVVGHVNPQGVATQADQGHEKLEDQDGCPYCGTDYKDDAHCYFLRRADATDWSKIYLAYVRK